MAVTRDSFTEGRLKQRLGVDPPRLASGAYDLRGANLARLSLTKARFEEADLSRANLRGADLQRARFEGAVLLGADLSEATLQDADFTGADLRSANLSRAVLDGTRLKDARCDDVELTGARLRNVMPWEAGLTPASVAEATLELAGLFSGDPLLIEVSELLHWCVLLGTQAEQWALRDALVDRRWRSWQSDLKGALGDLDRRLGALSDASISRVDPHRAEQRSLSRSADPQATPAGRSLSWLRSWRAGRRGEDSPADE